MKNLLVIFGGISSEHEISCISAYNIVKNLDSQKYSISLIGIDKEGKWYKYNGEYSNLGQNTWLNDFKNLEYIEKIFVELQKYDVVFPVLHGKMGEDGKIQGLFEVARVPYVGCNVLGSSIGMNKILSKKIVKEAGISIVDFYELEKNSFLSCNDKQRKVIIDNIVKELLLPLIIKPNQEGSSFGVYKVNKKEELEEKINKSFQFGDVILIEKYIDNRQEIECAVLENKNGKIIVSTPGEITSANEFYDFDAKYKNEDSYDSIPANVSNNIINKIKEYSSIIFRELNLSSIARIDFFVSDNNIYFNEVNTMPGFTKTSMYPKMLIHDGMSYSEILDILIENENRAK